MFEKRVNGVAAVLGCLLMASTAYAQAPISARAEGMAQAFVAVADDATSVYWNPAGMATGAFVSFVLDYGRGDQVPGGAAGGDRRHAGILAFTVPPLGLAYYRWSIVAAGPLGPAVPGVAVRQEGRRSVKSLTAGTIGVTFAQSVTDYLVVATTMKLVSGHAGLGTAVEGLSARSQDLASSLDVSDSLPTVSSTHGDVDTGLMLSAGHLRAGVAAHNLTRPVFEAPGGEAVPLDRDARAGVAWGSGWPGISRVVVAADTDLTRRVQLSGDRRDVAVGAETWWMGQRLGVRGGLRGSTIGRARPVFAGGVSAGVREGVFLEAHVARGREDERSWSVGARLTF